MYYIGQVVYSKSGRDKSRPFVVVAVENEYLYLADGEIRKLSRPKKKKTRHVALTHSHMPESETDDLKNGRLLDANVRRFLHCLKTI